MKMVVSYINLGVFHLCDRVQMCMMSEYKPC